MISFFKKVFSKKIMEMALEQFGSVSIKAFLLYTLLGVGIVFMVVFVCYLFKHKVRLSNLLAGIVIVMYGSIMLQLTLVCRESGSRIGIELDLFHGLTGPDNDFHWLMLAYVVLNCMLFIPYGFALSLFSVINERRTGVQCVLVLLSSLATSLFIETAQLITKRGYYEVQDLFFNTIGGVIGWILFRIVYLFGEKLLRRREA
ncbi:MAG: VanZ family protein [Lachnospiraceae bacterium]|nr:VanZ family protein [Lachnospiraceae bacterium]